MSQRLRPQNLADSVYDQLKSELFEFRLLPGDRFTEAEVADRTGASRTPVRILLEQASVRRMEDLNSNELKVPGDHAIDQGAVAGRGPLCLCSRGAMADCFDAGHCRQSAGTASDGPLTVEMTAFTVCYATRPHGILALLP